MSDQWESKPFADAIGADALFCDGDWIESKDQDPNGKVRLVQLADILDGEFKQKSERFMTHEKSDELRTTLLKEGDLLIARMPDPIGRACIFPGSDQDSVTVVDVAIARPTRCDPKWLMYYLNSHSIRAAIEERATGSTRKRISRSALSEMILQVPPLPEQKKIAEILSGIDRCIAQVKLRIEKQNLINESLLSDIEDLRSDKIARHEATIGDIASKVGSGITPRGGSDTYRSEGITFIRSQNVLKMRLSLGDAVKIPQHIHASMSGTRVQPNDVLLNITGASIGRSAVVPDGIGEANVNQHVCIIRTKETCDPLFLCGWLNSESGQIAINSSQAGGNRQGLNFEQIRAMSIPLPPVHQQKQISVALQASNSLIQLMQGKLDWLLNTKTALSSDLLSGRKRVSI